MALHPIETHYNGYRFRSRLEARWAVFFEHCGIQYTYEPEGYDLAQTVCPSPHDDPDQGWSCICLDREEVQGAALWYLPDFYLHNVSLRDESQSGLFFETKGLLAESPTESARCRLLGALTGRPVILATVPPFFPADNLDEGLWQESPGWDSHMCFMRCGTCGHIKVEFQEGSYMICPKCAQPASYKDRRIENAAYQSRQARFSAA
jgi:hypothetical protein